MVQCIVAVSANSAKHIGKRVDLDVSYHQLIRYIFYHHFAIGSCHSAFSAVFCNFVLILRIMHKVGQRRRF